MTTTAGVIPSAFNVLYDAERPVFHENWTTTPDHDGNTDADRISRKLQVANTDATAGKVVWSGFSCPEGWRKPTMMEMALIFTMGGAPESSYGADNAPVTETPLYNGGRIHSVECRLLLGSQACPPDVAAEIRRHGHSARRPAAVSEPSQAPMPTTCDAFGTLNNRGCQHTRPARNSFENRAGRFAKQRKIDEARIGAQKYLHFRIFVLPLHSQ